MNRIVTLGQTPALSEPGSRQLMRSHASGWYMRAITRIDQGTQLVCAFNGIKLMTIIPLLLVVPRYACRRDKAPCCSLRVQPVKKHIVSHLREVR